MSYITSTKNVAWYDSLYSYTSNVSAIKSNEQIFPQWLMKHGEKLVWPDSTPENNLRKMLLVKTEPANTPDVETAWLDPQKSVNFSIAL